MAARPNFIKGGRRGPKPQDAVMRYAFCLSRRARIIEAPSSQRNGCKFPALRRILALATPRCNATRSPRQKYTRKEGLTRAIGQTRRQRCQTGRFGRRNTANRSDLRVRFDTAASGAKRVTLRGFVRL